MQALVNKAGWVLAGIISLLVLAAVAGIVRAGPLDPPSTPGPTQENLIFQPTGACPAGFPIPISAPGSYKLAQNITGCSGQNGIQITASGVTLDLSGFTLAGVGGALIGINGPAAGTTSVRNGTIQGWTGAAVSLVSGVADQLTLAGNRSGLTGVNVVASNIVTEDNLGAGIDLTRGSIDGCVSQADNNSNFAPAAVVLTDSHLSNCHVYITSAGFGNTDIKATRSTLTHCAADNSKTTGIDATDSTLGDCAADSGGGTGILLVGSKIDGCTANNHTGSSGNGIVATDSTVVNCSADSNAQSGITLTRSQSSQCTANFNKAGVYATDSTVSDCTANNNAYRGFDVTRSTLSNCTANANSTDVSFSSLSPAGIYAYQSTIDTCTANGNFHTATGILANYTTIHTCTTNGNGGNGIWTLGAPGSLVEGCGVTKNNAEGIKAEGAGDAIVNNQTGENSVVSGNAEIYAHGAKTAVENNVVYNDNAGYFGFYIDSGESTVFGNTSHTGTSAVSDDYFISGGCSCDVGTITTAAAATNPRGNVGG